MGAPQRQTQQEALQARAREIIETALADEELMRQVRHGMQQIADGVPGVPLRVLQERERMQAGTGQ